MSIRKLLLSASCLSLFAAPAALASPDGGDPVLVSDAEALAMDAQQYARAYGVSFEEAARRMLLMHDSGDQVAQVEETNSSQLAGAFFDHSGEFELVVRVTGNAGRGPARFQRRAANAEAREKRAEIRQMEMAERREQRAARLAEVGLSEAQIDKAAEIIDSPQSAAISYRTGAPKTEKAARSNIRQNRTAIANVLGQNNFGYGYNVRDGSYRVMVTAEGTEAERLASKKNALEALLGGPVDLEISAVPTVLNHTRGGTALNASSTSSSHSCTGGFVGYEGSDRTKLGLLTAGHCRNSAYFKNPYDGSNYAISVPTASRDRFDAGMDMQWMTASHVAEGKFYATNSSSVRTVTGYRSRSNTSDTGFFGTADGSFICHYGKTTGQSCGEVYDKYAAPDYQPYGCSMGPTIVACDDEFVEVRNKVVSGEAQLACWDGDSGGPWFAYGVAFGIHSGGAPTSSAPGRCTKAFYTPIEKAANINATIYIP
uniref:hypothetical protein n=1 Tax=Parerythrobacter lutipelagi TaxID=1964208 RepID=UPI0010F5652D|nr:hypothetical protein [Parerythrobacter lutipelagi]